MDPRLQPVSSTPYAQGGDLALQQHRVLRNTYFLLALTLIPTVIGAAIGTNIDLSIMREHPIISLFAILAIFYGWIYAIERNRDTGVGVALLFGFTLFLGLLLGPLLQRVLGFSNGVQLVMMAAGGTAAVFFTLASVAATTKRDFSKLGSFLMVGAIVILLAVIANAFMQSPVLHLVLLCGFIILSSLMILFHVNSIVNGGETNYVSATLSLYIAIYNLFSALLQILGITSGNND
ncbi:MAG: Bax inhibitor-1 family protein [Burkholderiales bacterium]